MDPTLFPIGASAISSLFVFVIVWRSSNVGPTMPPYEPLKWQMWFTNFVKEDEIRRIFNQQAFICVSILHHRTAISDYILKAIGELARNIFAVHYISYHT